MAIETLIIRIVLARLAPRAFDYHVYNRLVILEHRRVVVRDKLSPLLRATARRLIIVHRDETRRDRIVPTSPRRSEGATRDRAGRTKEARR